MNIKSTFNNIQGDLFGGLTAGIVALPLALAFGEQTEMGAIAGLYGAIAIGLIAAIFGGTKTQISGPTAPMTVVSALIISKAIAQAGSVEAGIPIAIAIFIMAGLIQIIFGLLKLGKFIRYIPYPVVSGFMSGIGVIIIITQVFPFFGVNSPTGGPLGTIRDIHKIPEIINIYSVGIALLTIAIIYFLPRLTKKIPSTLVALVTVTIGAILLLPEASFLQIHSKGAIPTGLPKLSFGFIEVFKDFENMLTYMEYAVTLAALGAIDSLLTSVVADNMTKTKHDSNKELIGQGFGNMGAGLIGGLPGAGATMRTVINIKSGGKNKLSGVIAALLLLAILLGIGAYVGHIPNAVLAGILITVGIGIIDYKGFSHIKTIPRPDAVVMILVLFLTVFVDLLVAVAAGMVLSSLLFMKKAADVNESDTKMTAIEDYYDPSLDEQTKGIIKSAGKRIFIKRLNGPLFFGFAAKFTEMIDNIPDTEWVILQMDKVPYVDQSGLYALEDGIKNLASRNIKVVFSELQKQPHNMMTKFKLIPDLVALDDCYCSLTDGVRQLSEKISK